MKLAIITTLLVLSKFIVVAHELEQKAVDKNLHDDLLKAIRYCQKTEIEELYRQDKRLIDMDALEGETLLHYAYRWTRSYHLIKLLIELGADPNRKDGNPKQARKEPQFIFFYGNPTIGALPKPKMV